MLELGSHEELIDMDGTYAGSHEELIDMDGTYAELFHLQAQGYR